MIFLVVLLFFFSSFGTFHDCMCILEFTPDKSTPYTCIWFEIFEPELEGNYSEYSLPKVHHVIYELYARKFLLKYHTESYSVFYLSIYKYYYCYYACLYIYIFLLLFNFSISLDG